jgi:hypothetical protein
VLPVHRTSSKSVEAAVEARSGPHADQDEKISVDLEEEPILIA